MRGGTDTLPCRSLQQGFGDLPTVCLLSAAGKGQKEPGSQELLIASAENLSSAWEVTGQISRLSERRVEEEGGGGSMRERRREGKGREGEGRGWRAEFSLCMTESNTRRIFLFRISVPQLTSG